MMQNVPPIIITTIVGAITGVITWFATRRSKHVELERKNAEIANMKADSSQRIMDQYQEALDDLKQRYDARFDYLKEEYEMRHNDLKADYDRKYMRLHEEKEDQIQSLKKEIDSLRRNLETWKQKYRSLKTDIEKK